MSGDELLIRATAWVAFVLYVGAERMRRGRLGVDTKKGRWLFTVGCAALLVHIIFAFHYRHGWSESAAYADTARQTAALTGWNWGGGIYINYLFALVWVEQVVEVWGRRTPGNEVVWRMWAVRGFFLFMFVNGTVIFVRGPIRWLGAALCAVLIGVWFVPVKKREG